jgi:aminoglycoside/choline kinase family phosphotransferase
MTSQNSSTACPPDLSSLSSSLQKSLPFSATLDQCVPLAGDASNRRYYRLHLSGAPVASLILMQLADPEGFKASEEAVSGQESETSELPFINVLQHLQTVGSPVPILYFYDESAGLLFLQDFGDITLAQACHGASVDTIARWYRQAIDVLVRLHVHASVPSRVPCLALSRSFDVPLLMWEFDHFLEYGIVARRGKLMCSEDYVPIQEEFTQIAEWLAGQPMVFTHRDFHSRNLMVDGDRLGVIDFQDALLGPVTYDVASLLRDSYITLDESLIDSLLVYYREKMCQALPLSQHSAMSLNDHEKFRRLFDYTSIQRNLKAAGRFVYIDRVKGNPNFLNAIPRTLQNVHANLIKYPQLHRLLKYLSPYISEWQ